MSKSSPSYYPTYPNGNGSKSNTLSLIIASLAIVLALIQGFWSIADPRGNLAKLESKFDSYLTIREYEENKKSSARIREELVKDIEKVSEEQKTRTGVIATVRAMEKDLDKLKQDLDKLRESIVGSVTIRDTLKDVQEKIDKLRDKVLIPKTDIRKEN